MQLTWKKRQNFFYLNIKNYIKTNNINLKMLAHLLNTKKLIILTWLKNIWKLNFIKEFLNKTWTSINYFYFNKHDDIENLIKSNNDLEDLLNNYIQLYKNPKIIILQNISDIEWIKKFISKIYWLSYKVILIWNDIQITWIDEIEVLNNSKLTNENFNTIIKYWNLKEVRLVWIVQLKEKILKLITNDIFLNDIFLMNSVKMLDLYIYTITYLSKNSIFVSLRELQSNININKSISLKTIIDYVDFSLKAKIIKRVYKYDFKQNKTIKSKAKYYFTDNGIRNSLYNFNLNNNILIENLIFNKLEYYNFKIYSWLNWKFEFTFYWEKKYWFDSWGSKKIYIHIFKKESKEELKKEINKFLKVWINYKKYLLVNSILKLNIKKLKYENIEILEINDFLINFKPK